MEFGWELACRKCHARVTAPVFICPDCGPTEPYYAADPLHDSYAVACGTCGGILPQSCANPQRKIPKNCSDCGAPAPSWRNSSGTWWDPASFESTADSQWIAADFDGDYEGRLDSNNEISALGPRNFKFDLVRCELMNLRAVALPPGPDAADRREPLRISKIGHAFIRYRDADVGPERIYKADLFDFRLHAWDHASSEQIEIGTRRLIGRLWGTAYARLTPPASKMQEPVTNEAVQVAKQWSEKSASEAIPTSGAVPDGAKLKNSLSPPTPSIKTANERAHNRSYSKGVQLGEFLRRVWHSSWWPSTYWVGFPWRAVLILTLILLIAVGFRITLFALAVYGLHRLLHVLSISPLRSRLKGQWLPIAIPLMLLSIAVLSFGRVTNAIAETKCETPVGSGLLWLGVIFLVCAALRYRWLELFVGVLLLLATLLTAEKLGGMNCVGSAGVSAGATLSDAARRFKDSAIKLTANDQDAQLVSASEIPSDHGGRISIDQALQNPKKYFNCERADASSPANIYDIYFGESALFAFRQDRLNASSEAHLQKMAQLIGLYPDVHFVLTGHADSFGAPEANLKLSEQRAQSVADWLITNKIARPEQIDVRGVGDRYPVVNTPSLFRLNRRVEMRIDCPAI